MKYVCLVIVVLLSLLVIDVVRRIGTKKQAQPYSSYNHKYDPCILERELENDSAMDMMILNYKTNIPNGSTNSLKKLATESDLFKDEISLDDLMVEE